MRYLTLVLLFFMASCSYNDPYTISAKKAVIPADTLGNIILEIHLAKTIRFTEPFTKQYGVAYVNAADSIIKKHGYKRADFDSTLSAYSANPQKLNDIYESVLTRLSKMEGEINIKEQKSDSVR